MKQKSKRLRPKYDLKKVVTQDIDNNSEYDYPRMVFGEHTYKLLDIKFKDKICFLDIEPIEGGEVISCNADIWRDKIFYETFFAGRMCLVFERKLNLKDDIYR
jgi:nicotinamide riboside kinase